MKEESLPSFDEGGVSGTLIAGHFFGLAAGAALSPLFYAHLELAPGSRFALPAIMFNDQRLMVVEQGQATQNIAGVDRGAEPMSGPSASQAF